MNPTSIFLFIIVFLLSSAASICSYARPEPDGPTDAELKSSKGGLGEFFGPGSGFNIPGFGKDFGGGYGFGSGYGGPNGGRSRSGTVRPSVVCKERGPCYNKKLTCPAKCFTSYSRSGKGYGGGGGGGGCSMDCKKKCVAYC